MKFYILQMPAWTQATQLSTSWTAKPRLFSTTQGKLSVLTCTIFCSDLSSCGIQSHTSRTPRPSPPPSMPGKSPTPLQPCIILTPTSQVLSLNTCGRTFAGLEQRTRKELNIVVAINLLKPSWTFLWNCTTHMGFSDLWWSLWMTVGHRSV